MGIGILLKDTTLYNDVFDIIVPAKTIVLMFRDGHGVPTVVFKDVNIVCKKIDGKWYADAYDRRLLIKFPNGGEPYPFQYFK